MTQGPVDVRCDLCESPDRPVWIYRVHEFQIGYEGEPPMLFPEGNPWGVCARCKADILADDQDSIMRRRRAVATMWQGGQMGRNALTEYLRFLDLVIMSFLSSRDKEWPGRAFTANDFVDAYVQVAGQGRRF